MPGSDSIFAILALVPCIAILAYSAYWALGIRRALAVGIYRTQALGIGLVSIAVIITQAGITFTANSTSSVFQIIFPYFAATTIFYWTDASMRTGRRSDPLLRDTLQWSKLRWVIVAVIIIAPIYVLIGLASPATASNLVLPSFFFVGILPVVVPLLVGAIVLPVMGFRSGYQALRKQLLWFGLFALSILVVTVFLGGIIFSGPTSAVALPSLLVQDLGVVLGGYCLYRSARSLAPLNQISIDQS